MRQTLMFMPIHPQTGKPAPYSRDDFHEQLTRFGIEMPELDEGSQYYSFEWPGAGGQRIEAEVMVLVEDDVVLGVSIDAPKPAGKALWLQLLAMGYIMRDADDDAWCVSAAWAAEFERADRQASGVGAIKVVRTIADF
jgi:hypothetical protein